MVTANIVDFVRSRRRHSSRRQPNAAAAKLIARGAANERIRPLAAAPSRLTRSIVDIHQVEVTIGIFESIAWIQTSERQER